VALSSELRNSRIRKFRRKRQEVRARPTSRERWAACGVTVGVTGAVITVVLCAANAVSAQQAIAMALLAGTTAIGGLVCAVIPDAWTAWRRGFQHGYEAALRFNSSGLDAEPTKMAVLSTRRPASSCDPASERLS
jgi:hypothetical protein